MSSFPSPWIVGHTGRITAGGLVLDLAAGGGRHSRWLATQGFRVLAVHRDREAMNALAGIPGIQTRVVDLEGLGRPQNPDYLLNHGELLDACIGPLRLIAYEHPRDESAGNPAIRQRLCAIQAS